MKMKRYIALALAAVLLLSVSACGKEDTALKDKPEATVEPSAAAHRDGLEPGLYLDLYFPFETGCTLEGAAFTAQTLAAVGRTEDKYSLSLSRFTIEAGAKPVFAPAEILSLNELYNMTSPVFSGIIAKGETLYLLFFDTAAENEGQLLALTQEGQLIDTLPLGKLHKDGVNSFVFCGERRIAVYGHNIALIDLDTGEQELISLGKDDYAWSAVPCSKGIAVFTDIKGCSLLDTENLSMTPADSDVHSICVCQDYAGKCLYYDSQALCEFNVENRQSNELLAWGLAKAPGGFVRYIGRLDETTFLVLGSNTDMVQVIGQTMKIPVENSTVNVAVIKDSYGTETQAGRRIMETESQSVDYHYIVTEYEPEELNRLRTEISTGNAPDLLLFGREFDTSSELFEDLYPYLDGDEELSRDSLLPGLLPALEVKGQLHELWTAATIYTVAIRASDYDPDREFTTEYCRELMDKHGYRSVFGFMTADDLLLWIGSVSTGAFVDKNAGTCDFTGGDFAALLQWCHDMDLSVAEGREGVRYERDEIMLSLESLSNLHRLMYWREIFGQPMAIVGFPNTAGNGSFYVNEGIGMAIPVNSSNKEGAWNFIRSQLSLRSQLNPINLIFSLPVNCEALSRYASTHLEQPEYEQLMALVEQTDHAIDYSSQQINQIIIECGRNYLAGKSSLEDTVAAVQSRAGIYLAERYG